MLTVFIGTFNRLETLQRTITSYERLTTPHELVIVDNGSDDPACISLLEQLERDVKKIYRLPRCITYQETTENFDIAFRDQYERNEADWFAVSEADVCFDGTDKHALGVYLTLAKSLGRAVGAHLRVDEDIPVGYPLRSRVLAAETWPLFPDGMKWHKRIPYRVCDIDTTFHLFPAARSFARLKMDTVRVGAPYDVMHLDWYVDVFNPTRENWIYIPDERPLGSWGKSWIRGCWLGYQQSPERGFEVLMAEPLDPTDLCNVAFMRSWAYQYGFGVEKNIGESQVWLEEAIPFPNERYWGRYSDWSMMIYQDDFSSLELVPPAQEAA